MSDETIVHAFNNPILVEALDEGMTMFIGPDPPGNLSKIGVIGSGRGGRWWFKRCVPGQSA